MTEDKKQKFIFIVAAFLVLLVSLNTVVIKGSGIDVNSYLWILSWYTGLDNDFYSIVIRSFIVLFTAIGSYLALSKNKKVFLSYICCILVSVSLVNTVYFYYEAKKEYENHTITNNSGYRINKYLESVGAKGDEVLVVLNTLYTETILETSLSMGHYGALVSDIDSQTDDNGFIDFDTLAYRIYGSETTLLKLNNSIIHIISSSSISDDRYTPVFSEGYYTVYSLK